jgi:hypothetical protein
VIVVRSINKGVLGSIGRGVLGIIAVGALVTLGGVTPAYALSPWWHLTSATVPSELQAGQATNEVQEIEVAATGGEVTVVEPVSYEEALAGGGFAVLKYSEFPYDATQQEAQAALETVYGTGNVEVQGGPGDGTGTKPYVVTFTGKLADQPLPLIMTSFNLGGLEGGAVVTEQAKGSADGELVVTAANLGDSAAEGAKSPITITDKLPAGLGAVSVSGKQGNLYEPGTAPACSLQSSSLVSCTFTRTIPPYVGAEVTIGVVVRPGAQSGEEDEASVSGGKAGNVFVTRPLRVGGAPAQFGVTDYELVPEEEGGVTDTQAGSHPFQLTDTIAFDQLDQKGERLPAALVKDLHFKLPPGLIGNPHPFAQCTLVQFNEIKVEGNLCAMNTVVGVVRVLVNNRGTLDTFVTPLFNLEPAFGEPARFGFIAPGTPVMLNTSVRTGGNYGVTVSVNNISQTAAFLGSEVTFWGVPGDPQHDSARNFKCLTRAGEEEEFVEDDRVGELPVCDGALGEHAPPPLLSMPTSCTGPLQSSVETDSWKQDGAFSSYPLTVPMPALDGCNRLPFSSSITVAPDGEAGSTPTGLTVGIHVPQEEALSAEGLAPSTVKDTTVALPEGVALSPAAADGLESCSIMPEPGRPEGQLALNSSEAISCPEASKVGTLEITSPLLPEPLQGAAYLAAQTQNPFGSLLALYLVAEDPTAGFLLKVAGEVKANPVTGQLISTFNETPQLPFEDLKLHFFGGARAPLATPALCGSYTTTASITPWSESQPSTSSSTFNITSGPNGKPCPNPRGDQSLDTLPFSPSLTAGMTSIQAGGFSPFTMTMSREDGQQSLDAVQLHMPPGLLGTLSTVKLCGEAEANAGTCGSESLIGETIVSVGLGGDPYNVTGGKVYITGPYGGAPYGLSIVNPAKAGPFNLGTVVVRAKIEVDPITAALTVTTDSSGAYAIPQILDGIPLQIKHVNVTINRAGFTFNPTNCAPTSVTGSLSSSQGASSALSVPFQVTNCATLAFKPKLTASTSGKTSRKNGTSLALKIAYPKNAMGNEAWFKRAKFDFPKQLPARLTTLQKACPAAKFDANPASCPAESHAGTALVSTPVLPDKLTGVVYFVSYGDEKFPEAVIVLQGDGVTVDLHAETFIDSKTGVTSATLKSIPGVPFSSVEVNLPAGPYSEFAANGDLCTSKLKMPIAFTAQNGLAIHQSTQVKVTGCRPKHKAKKSKKASKRRAKSKRK